VADEIVAASTVAAPNPNAATDATAVSRLVNLLFLAIVSLFAESIV
jgi:hypothetical protein